MSFSASRREQMPARAITLAMPVTLTFCPDTIGLSLRGSR